MGNFYRGYALFIKIQPGVNLGSVPESQLANYTKLQVINNWIETSVKVDFRHLPLTLK